VPCNRTIASDFKLSILNSNKNESNDEKYFYMIKIIGFKNTKNQNKYINFNDMHIKNILIKKLFCENNEVDNYYCLNSVIRRSNKKTYMNVNNCFNNINNDNDMNDVYMNEKNITLLYNNKNNINVILTDIVC